MRYVAAYLLSSLGGKESPTAADLNKIIASVGVDCDEAQAKRVIEAMKGKDMQQLIADGSKKLAAMPAGGGGAAAPVAAAASGGGAAAPAEEKKEEKKAESESEDEDMGFGLFD